MITLRNGDYFHGFKLRVKEGRVTAFRGIPNDWDIAFEWENGGCVVLSWNARHSSAGLVDAGALIGAITVMDEMSRGQRGAEIVAHPALITSHGLLESFEDENFVSVRLARRFVIVLIFTMTACASVPDQPGQSAWQHFHSMHRSTADRTSK